MKSIDLLCPLTEETNKSNPLQENGVTNDFVEKLGATLKEAVDNQTDSNKDLVEVIKEALAATSIKQGDEQIEEQEEDEESKGE